MNTTELAQRMSNGEDSFTQFKRQAIPAKELAKEFVAFLNAEGGIIIFGVVFGVVFGIKDKTGLPVGLSYAEVGEIGQLVGNCANENVKPPFHPLVENITIDNNRLVVVHIPKGISRPYATNSGNFYIKSSADKKKISQEELRRLFAESKRLFADEEIVHGSSAKDLDLSLFKRFLEKDNPFVYEEVRAETLPVDQVLQNLDLLKNDQLTLAGNLLFGMYPQKFNKSFYIDYCYFDGNDVSVDSYKSKRKIDGHFLAMFNASIEFLKSSLRNMQSGNDFNSPAKLEIDERVLAELIINAL
ncbi:MAG: putative DNA binding domain-containing protein, partial [Leptonema sp. (in: Bacteria)]|nr:putative DNA binding domain-containing protein [Leptonema sp. (in: bacteria)]